jgi:transcriptional regulator with XRE-family HTH domain
MITAYIYLPSRNDVCFQKLPGQYYNRNKLLRKLFFDYETPNYRLKRRLKSNPVTIGDRIRNLRVQKGLTIDQIVNQRDIPRSVLNRYERNEIDKLDPWTLEKIAKALGIDPIELLVSETDVKDIFDYFCPPITLGAKIRNLRLKKHLQQKDLAKMLGIHKVSLCRYEKDQSKPDKQIILKIEQILNTKF